MSDIKLIAQLEVLNADHVLKLKELELSNELCKVQRELIAQQNTYIETLKGQLAALTHVYRELINTLELTLKSH